MPVSSYLTIEGEILAMDVDWVAYDLVPDPQGSVVTVLDASQQIVSEAAYWPYGETRTLSGNNPTSFRYLGTLGYYEDAPGRTYVRARTLREDLARWQTVDPLWPDQNPYVYADSSPVTRTDPSGLACSSSDFQKCWDMGYGGCIEHSVETQIGPFCFIGHAYQCVGDRKGRDYRNCRALQAGCYAAVLFRPPSWDYRRWYHLCDQCYGKCKTAGVIGAISTGCDFWNMTI